MSVFKRLPRTHMHVRTPIMLALVVILVLLLSAFCYYGPMAPGRPPLGRGDGPTPHELWNGGTADLWNL